MQSASTISLPVTLDGVDLTWVRAALNVTFPQLEIRDLQVHEVSFSTGTRVDIELGYGANGDNGDDAADLPTQLCVKGGFDCPDFDKRAITFRQEALTYRDLLPTLSMPRPACYFADIDENNGQGVVILENVVAAGGKVNRAPDAPTVEGAAAYLDTLAMLHAGTWNAPRLDQLTWLKRCMSDDDLFRHWWDAAELECYLQQEGRGEVVDPALQDPNRLLAMIEQLAPIAARGPRALLHGDTHIGNTYWDAAGHAAFLDWQGVTQGPPVRDVSYFMASNIDVGDRRAHERDLLAHYLERLTAYGVDAPSVDELWTEYRRWMVVPLLVWIRNSDRHQLPGANRLGAQRSSTAIMDLDVLDLYV